MKITRRQILESKEAMTSIVNREFSITGHVLPTLARLYTVYVEQIKALEIHNNALLSKLGQRDAEKNVFYIRPEDANFKTYVDERNAYMAEGVDAGVESIRLTDLKAMDIKLKPFELADLAAAGVISVNYP